jgi:hypothetical protein
MTNPAPPDVPMVATTKTREIEVKSGRRWYDWKILFGQSRSIFFWIFGVFLDEKHKPSMSRMMLAGWTWIGSRMIYQELNGHPAVSNPAWTAWWAAEGFLGVAVFGPRIASYFGQGAAGATASIATAVRDEITKFQRKEDT